MGVCIYVCDCSVEIQEAVHGHRRRREEAVEGVKLDDKLANRVMTEFGYVTNAR